MTAGRRREPISVDHAGRRQSVLPARQRMLRERPHDPGLQPWLRRVVRCSAIPWSALRISTASCAMSPCCGSRVRTTASAVMPPHSGTCPILFSNLIAAIAETTRAALKGQERSRYSRWIADTGKWGISNCQFCGKFRCH